MDKIDGWFQDKLDWVAVMYDSDYKTYITGELAAKRDAALADLQARYDGA